jgi:hypothetical protein
MANALQSRIDQATLAPKPFAAPTSRAKVTNGTKLLAGVDQRSASYRRFRDLVADLVAEQGRELSISEIGLIRSVAALLVRSEELQAAAVRGEDVDADELIRTASEARRLLSSLRKPARREPEQPSLQTYLREQYGEGAPASEAAPLVALNRKQAPEELIDETRTSEAAP